MRLTFVILLSTIGLLNYCFSQPCSDCTCGTQPVTQGFDPNPNEFRGGLFKPATSNTVPSSSIPEYIDSFKVSSCYTGSGANFLKYPVRYRVQAIDKHNDESVLSDFAKTAAGTVTSGEQGDNITINENSLIPKEYSLKQNYPNPFNPSTNIQYDLPFDNFVSIKIYDILGKEVITIVNEFKNAGSYIVTFNGSNLSSGIYYYKINSGNFQDIKKMILIK